MEYTQVLVRAFDRFLLINVDLIHLKVLGRKTFVYTVCVYHSSVHRFGSGPALTDQRVCCENTQNTRSQPYDRVRSRMYCLGMRIHTRVFICATLITRVIQLTRKRAMRLTDSMTQQLAFKRYLGKCCVTLGERERKPRTT